MSVRTRTHEVNVNALARPLEVSAHHCQNTKPVPYRTKVDGRPPLLPNDMLDISLGQIVRRDTLGKRGDAIREGLSVQKPVVLVCIDPDRFAIALELSVYRREEAHGVVNGIAVVVRWLKACGCRRGSGIAIRPHQSVRSRRSERDPGLAEGSRCHTRLV